VDRPRSAARAGWSAAIAVVALVLFGALGVSVYAGWSQALDVRLMLAIGEARPLWLTRIMQVASVVGSGTVEIPLGLLLSFRLARIRRRTESAGYASAVLSGWALYGLAKLIFHRPRPRVIPRLMHGAGWYSFPSGHATLAPLVFGLGALIWAAPWPRRTRAVLLAAAAALSVLIAYSRVYLGMHWPTDALGGLLLGTGWSALWVAWWERRAAKDGGGRAE
jgi:undecaprenyl-diphosphatase